MVSTITRARIAAAAAILVAATPVCATQFQDLATLIELYAAELPVKLETGWTVTRARAEDGGLVLSLLPPAEAIAALRRVDGEHLSNVFYELACAPGAFRQIIDGGVWLTFELIDASGRELQSLGYGGC